jgi:hypothetical protein
LLKIEQYKVLGFDIIKAQHSGGGRRDRTDDPLLAKQVLSQLSYAPLKHGGSGRNRTYDPRLIKTVL